MIIEPGMLLNGTLVVSGALLLNGRFDGTLSCTRLEIGPDGYLAGDAAADEIVVEGQVVGTIRARSVVVHLSAMIEGDVHHEQLAIEAGAVVTGECLRLKTDWRPADFARLQQKFNRESEAMRQLEAASMARVADEAATQMPAYERLRARFSTAPARA